MSKFSWVIFTAVAVFCCFSNVVAQQSPKTVKSGAAVAQPTPAKVESKTPFDGKVAFPDVDGWERLERRDYPTPELGYSVGYITEDGQAVTVYVYDLGIKNIPNTLTGPVSQQLEQASADIQKAVELGAYQSAKVVKSETLTLGGTDGKVRTLYRLFDLRANGRELDSEIYVFPYQGYFVKLRVTRPKSEASDNLAMADLLKELDRLFAL